MCSEFHSVSNRAFPQIGTHVFKETEELLTNRLKITLQKELNVIYCVGELLEERKKGTTFEVIEKQLSNLKAAIATLGEAVSSRIVIAYEPVWAIGTGENATPDQAEEAHAYIRGWWKKNAHNAEALRILYGGSVKPENAKSLMAEMDVDGLLVGGSSLDPNAFAEIIKNGLLSAL
jgi:triosephosphate isomerase